MKKLNKQRLIILIVAGVGVIAAFMPWMKVSAFGMSQSSSGMSHGIAILAFLAYIGVGVVAFLGERENALVKKRRQLVLILGAVGALWSLWRLIQIMSQEMVSAGIGCWLSLLAGLALVGIYFFMNSEGEIELPDNKD